MTNANMEEDNPFSKAQTVHPEVRAYVYSLVNAVCCRCEYVPEETLTLSSSVAPARTMTAATYSVTMPLLVFAT